MSGLLNASVHVVYRRLGLPNASWFEPADAPELSLMSSQQKQVQYGDVQSLAQKTTSLPTVSLFLNKKNWQKQKKNGCLSIFLASHTLQIGDVWVQGFHSIMHNNSIRSPQLVYLTFLYFTRSTSFSMPACVMSSAKPYFLASSAPFRIQNCSPRSAGSSTGVGKTNWSFPWWSPSPRQLQVAKSTHISPNVYLGKSYVLQPAKDAKWNSYRKGDPWSVRFSVSVHSGYLPAFRKQTYLVGKSIYFLCPNRKHIYTFMVNVPANCVERPLHSWGP